MISTYIVGYAKGTIDPAYREVEAITKTNFNKNYSMQTVHRAIQILKAFSREQRRLSLTEIHKKTGITMSSLQRLTSTLVYEGFLHKNDRTKEYQLGLGLLFLGELVERNTGLLFFAQPVLERLNHITTESVSLNVIENNERRCIYNLESQHKLSANTYVGDTSPLYAGASAKVLLAHLPGEEVARYLQRTELKSITDRTILSKEQLVEDLRKIKAQGYAISNGERVKGTMSFSAPILNEYSEVLAAMTIVIPSVRIEEYDKDVLLQEVLKGCAEVNAQLAGQMVEE